MDRVSRAQIRENPASYDGEIKRVADGRETPAVIPVILEPIEIGVALRIVPVETNRVAVAIRVLPDRTIVRNIFQATISQIFSRLNLIRNLLIP